MGHTTQQSLVEIGEEARRQERKRRGAISAEQAAVEDPATRRIIGEEAATQEAIRRAALEEQTGVQQQRLTDLAGLLAQEEQRQFGQAIPEIAGTAQAQGFLETSGFGGALARERTNLAGRSQFLLGQQALSDRESEIQGLRRIEEGTTGFLQGGLQREFSLSDFDRQRNLANELARLGASANRQPAGGGGGAGFAGALGGAGIGAGIATANPLLGAGIGLIAGGAAGTIAEKGGTYICTHLKNLGHMTQEEVDQVHNKIFPYAFLHPIDLINYAILAPRLIKDAQHINWEVLKPLFCDNILKCKTQKEAFKLYRNTLLVLIAHQWQEVYNG